MVLHDHRQTHLITCNEALEIHFNVCVVRAYMPSYSVCDVFVALITAPNTSGKPQIITVLFGAFSYIY